MRRWFFSLSLSFCVCTFYKVDLALHSKYISVNSISIKVYSVLNNISCVPNHPAIASAIAIAKKKSKKKNSSIQFVYIRSKVKWTESQCEIREKKKLERHSVLVWKIKNAYAFVFSPQLDLARSIQGSWWWRMNNTPTTSTTITTTTTKKSNKFAFVYCLSWKNMLARHEFDWSE